MYAPGTNSSRQRASPIALEVGVVIAGPLTSADVRERYPRPSNRFPVDRPLVDADVDALLGLRIARCRSATSAGSDR